jgi:hypothetical protein
MEITVNAHFTEIYNLLKICNISEKSLTVPGKEI